MSGSSPCQVTDRFYATLVQQARQAGIRTLVDTYGPCLAAALEAGPEVVKMNRKECEEVTGKPLDSAASIRDALAWIPLTGVSLAAIMFGPRGMAAAWENQVTAWRPPPIQEVNPIGAGDAMAAGLIDALLCARAGTGLPVGHGMCRQQCRGAGWHVTFTRSMPSRSWSGLRSVRCQTCSGRALLLLFLLLSAILTESHFAQGHLRRFLDRRIAAPQALTQCGEALLRPHIP